MDVAYNQHSQHARKNNRSSTNVGHLSLAPLTSRLPLNDFDELPTSLEPRAAHDHRISYLEGKSAPTTPGILSRSSSRVSLRKQTRDEGLAKSRSSANIANSRQQTLKSGLTTPGGRFKRPMGKDDLSLTSLTAADSNDSDWLLRASALISTGTKESKGQAWLVSRASSTSLTGQGDEDEDEEEKSLARERESRRGSNGGAFGDADDEFSPITTRMSFGGGASRPTSRYGSRPTSRVHSRRGSRINLASPLVHTAKEKQGYFDREEDFLAEPDFVDVDEDVDYETQAAQDEVTVRRLAKTGSGLGIWVEKLMGWSLFAVEEDGEDSDVETNGDKTDGSAEGIRRSRSELRYKEDVAGDVIVDEKLPPPGDEEGGWQDAAWLLSVATKVLL